MSELIPEAAGEQDYRAFAQLISEYVAWLRSRYKEDTWFITEVLDRQSLSSELESLPTVYGPPNGRVFAAVQGNEVRGCGAYRRIGDGFSECPPYYAYPEALMPYFVFMDLPLVVQTSS